jgi:MFS family permease
VTAALIALNARTFRSLRKHRNYRLFFSGQIVSLCGTWMQNIALPYFVYHLTHSPLAVGFLVFCRFIPFTIFGLSAGVVADRLDNRRLVIGTQTAAMMLSAALAGLAWSGAATVWEAYLLAGLSGTVLVFDAPGRHSLTFQMVGRAELPNAIALNASMFNAARVVGPAVGGVLIALVGVGACFTINAISFLAVLVSLLLMRVDELFPVQRDEPPTMWNGIREGLDFARSTARVRMVLLLTVVVATVGFNFHVLVPVLASDTLHAGAVVFGVLSASFGAGALTGALLTAALGRASWKALLAGLAGFSSLLLALAPLRSPVACAFLLYGIGVCFTVWSSNSQAILQLAVPDRLRGRILSIYLWAFAGLAPLGGLLAGWLSDIGGTELAFLVAGATGAAMAAFAVVRSPRPAPRAVPLAEPDRIAA